MRVFIAIDIPKELKEKIYKISKEISEVKGRFVEKENYHITLKFLGEIQPHIIKRIEEVLEDITFSKIKAEIYGAGLFNRRVLWFGIRNGKEEIINLQKNIDDFLKKLGFEKEKNYIPHITILRIKQIINEKSFNKFLEKYSNTTIGSFYIDKFLLKQSILTPQGPIYRDIKEFYLEG